MNGDGHVDTNTGTNPIAHVMTGASAQTVIVHATDSNFNSSTATIVLHPGRSPAGCVPEESIGVLRIRAACIRHEGDTIVADPEPSERYWSNYVVSLNGVSLVTRDPNATVSFNVHDHEIVAHGRFRVMLLNAPGGDITFLEVRRFHAGRCRPARAGPAASRRRSSPSRSPARARARARTTASIRRCAEVPGGFPVVGPARPRHRHRHVRGDARRQRARRRPARGDRPHAPAGERGARPRARLGRLRDRQRGARAA